MSSTEHQPCQKRAGVHAQGSQALHTSRPGTCFSSGAALLACESPLLQPRDPSEPHLSAQSTLQSCSCAGQANSPQDPRYRKGLDNGNCVAMPPSTMYLGNRIQKSLRATGMTPPGVTELPLRMSGHEPWKTLSPSCSPAASQATKPHLDDLGRLAAQHRAPACAYPASRIFHTSFTLEIMQRLHLPAILPMRGIHSFRDTSDLGCDPRAAAASHHLAKPR